MSIKLKREDFNNSYTIIKDQGNGVRIDLVVDPYGDIDNETHFKVINMKKTGSFRFIYAYDIDSAIDVYNDEVKQNEGK